MGFCPELARPLGAPTLILREAGRIGRVMWVTVVQFSEAATVTRGARRLLLHSACCVGMLHPLLGHNCQLTHIAQPRRLNYMNPEVNKTHVTVMWHQALGNMTWELLKKIDWFSIKIFIEHKRISKYIYLTWPFYCFNWFWLRATSLLDMEVISALYYVLHEKDCVNWSITIFIYMAKSARRYWK